MSEKQRHFEMEPMSGEPVEADGVYKNEWGREVPLKRGQVFPADPQLGTTEWELAELEFSNHHEGHTDPRLVPKSGDKESGGSLKNPRRHVDRGDK